LRFQVRVFFESTWLTVLATAERPYR